MVVNEEKDAFEPGSAVRSHRGFIPQGPYIPVSEIPNEIRRFFLGKKEKVKGHFHLAYLTPEEVHRLTTLLQAALVIFILAALVAMVFIAVIVVYNCVLW